MNIIDPSFEERQKANPEKDYKEFFFHISHMNQSGALFDLVKLSFVSKEWLAKLDKPTFVERCIERAHKYNPELHEIMLKHTDYTFSALNIERCTELDPKRFHKLSDIAEQLPMFYDENYEAHYSEKPAYPENMTPDIIHAFVDKYCAEMNLALDKTTRFEQLKEIGKNMPEGMRFAPSGAEFKEGGYIGKTGDLAMFLRIQLLLSKTTPDLCETMKVMGKERVAARLRKAVA